MVGKDAWKEYRDFTIALEKQNLQPGVIKEAVLKKLKEGGFQHAEAIEKLVKFNFPPSFGIIIWFTNSLITFCVKSNLSII